MTARINRGIHEDTLFFVKSDERIKLMKVKDIYKQMVSLTKSVRPLILCDGTWQEATIRPATVDEYTVIKLRGFDDKIICGSRTAIYTPLGNVQARKLKVGYEAVQTIKDIGVEWGREFRRRYPQNCGRMVGVFLRYGSIESNPFDGVWVQMLIPREVDQKIYPNAVGSFLNTIKYYSAKPTYEREEVSGGYVMYKFHDEYVVHFIEEFLEDSFMDTQDYPENFSPKVVMPGIYFTRGFIEGWFSKEEDLHCIRDISSDYLLKKLKAVAGVSGYKFIEKKDDDGLTYYDLKSLRFLSRGQTLRVEDVKTIPNDKDNPIQFYNIQFKDSLFPYYRLDSGVLVSDMISN